MRIDRRSSQKSEKKSPARAQKRGVVGYSKKSALLEEAVAQMNTGKYGRSSATLKELLALDPQNMEARRLFATLHLKLGNLVTARQAFESLATEAIGRQDYWLAESLLQEYLAAGPRCIPFLELLAEVHQAKGDEIAAVRELGKAIEILRDDSDPEHREKAAKLYARIRELAPVSPTAIELAALFDVRTGELLAPSQKTIASPAGSDGTIEDFDSSDSTAASQSANMEIMPWEVLEEDISTTSSLSAVDTHVGETVGDQRSVVEEVDSHVPLPPKVVEEERADPSLRYDEESKPNDAASMPPDREPSAKELDHTLPLDVAASSSISSEERTTSLMASDQVVDIPVEIPEVLQISPSPDPLAAIPEMRSAETNETGVEAIAIPLDSLSPQSLDVDPPSAAIASVPEDSHSLLPKPMPWEEEADASVQITGGESPTISAAGEAPETNSSVEASERESQQQLASAQLQAAGDVEEESQSSGLSWDSIFDKAWKLAAGVVSPGRTAVDENPPETFEEAQGTQAPTGEDSLSVTIAEESSDPGVETVGSGIEEPTAMSLETAEHHGLSATSLECPPQGIAAETGLNSVEVTRTNESPPDEDVAESSDQTVAASDTEPAFKLLQSLEIPLPISTSGEVLDAGEETNNPNLDAPMVESAVAEVPPASTEPLPLVSDSARGDILSGELAESGEETELSVIREQVLEELPQSDTASSPTDRSPHWDTGEVAIQLHRPTTKKKPWQKDRGQSPEDGPTTFPEFDAESEVFSESIIEPKVSSVEATPVPIAEEVRPPEDTRPDWMQASEAITSARPTSSESFEQEPSRSGQDDQLVEPNPSPQVASAELVPLPVAEEVRPPEDTRPDWMQASEAITFARQTPSESSKQERSHSGQDDQSLERLPSTAESAVGVLFESNEDEASAKTWKEPVWSKPRPRLVARLHRGRIAATSLISSCFSATRSLTVFSLTILVVMAGLAVLSVGALSVVWMIMEQPATERFQNLTKIPTHTISDVKKNGYILLMGFDVPAGQDPLQTGNERIINGRAFSEQACLGGESRNGSSSAGASGHVVKGWFNSSNPAASIARQSDTVRSLTTHKSLSLSRYRQWLTMPFDDWGYGQGVAPDCSEILLAHRLFVAEGFGQGTVDGLNRLESDVQAWRTVLGQSKTLAVKMLAVTALQDDVMTVSGLLNQPEFDVTSLNRLSRIMRPLDQVELSLRWPMQSEFVRGTKAVPAELKQDKSDDRPWYVSLVAALKLPVQQRANAYADYYEDSSKAMAEGRFTNLPKRSDYMRTPATGLTDYLANPIEHIVGIEPLPLWDPYVLRMVETDARLRLVGLQAWVKRSQNDGDVLTRLAKAGQAYYDPFTGFPMLVNRQKHVIYSVGQDGKDQEGDPSSDIVVEILPVSP